MPTPVPRFGWFNFIHHHIERTAVDRMSGHDPELQPWKRHLAVNQEAIHAANDLQDYFYPGNRHFFDMLTQGNIPGASLRKIPAGRPFRCLPRRTADDW